MLRYMFCIWLVYAEYMFCIWEVYGKYILTIADVYAVGKEYRWGGLYLNQKLSTAVRFFFFYAYDSA